MKNILFSKGSDEKTIVISIGECKENGILSILFKNKDTLNSPLLKGKTEYSLFSIMGNYKYSDVESVSKISQI